MNTIHAHVDTYAVDCDGPISRSYVMTTERCEGSFQPVGAGSVCRPCGQSFGYPHPENAVVGRKAPLHLPTPHGDIEFHNEVLSHVVNTYSIMEGVEGILTVLRDEDGVTLNWAEQTDEGGRSAVAVICENNDCDLEERSYRDHRAEAAGY